MEIEFNARNLHRLDLIKNELMKNYKEYGLDIQPTMVTDKLALDYAIAFTAEVMSYKAPEESK